MNWDPPFSIYMLQPLSNFQVTVSVSLPVAYSELHSFIFPMKSIMSKDSSARDLSVFESEWFESKDDINEQKSLKSVLLNSLQKSSVYAVSQLVTSSGFGRRILWFLVLLVGLCGCSYEIYHFLTLYFQYPVVITLEVKNNWKLDFPAVTVCNLNR